MPGERKHGKPAPASPAGWRAASSHVPPPPHPRGSGWLLVTANEWLLVSQCSASRQEDTQLWGRGRWLGWGHPSGLGVGVGVEGDPAHLVRHEAACHSPSLGAEVSNQGTLRFPGTPTH